MLRWVSVSTLGLAACTVGVPGGGLGEGGSTGSAPPTDTASESSTTSGAAESSGGGLGLKLDVLPPDVTAGEGEPPSCKVPEGGEDAVGPCDDEAPANSFTPHVEWEWFGQDEDTQVVATPLVANLTDDNGSGAIDLCDTPDIVVMAYDDCDAGECLGVQSRVYVLDGATGTVHFRADVTAMSGSMRTPALGDIDDDGIAEIVVPGGGGITALEHDGTRKWSAPGSGGPLAIADLDNDGSPEIFGQSTIWSADGDVILTLPHHGARTAADLDGDGDLELVGVNAAHHHDGSVYYEAPGVGAQLFAAAPQIANVDDDPEPEVIVTNEGISILEHDGTPKVLGYPQSSNNSKWARPAAIHDVDGDGRPELAAGSGWQYNVIELDELGLAWSTSVLDQSAAASGTAFDFLGDGGAEAMYADEETLFIFDDAGNVVLSVPRTSWTDIELPIVADVDNDGSAEIVVVSNKGYIDGTSPAVQVIGDIDDRWIQARRIWNQHTYHVTNVREDGTIPQFEAPSWTNLNTFRTQSQIEGGSVCTPPAG